MKRRVLVAFLSIVFSAGTAVAATVQNGSFEQGSPVATFSSQDIGSVAIPGWAVIERSIAWIGPSNTWGLTASEGDYFLDLTDYATDPNFGGVSQEITTDIGAHYAVSFDLGSSLQWGLQSSITVSAGNTTEEFTSSNSGQNNVWESQVFIFMATSELTELSFLGTDGYKYVGLDNVSISEFVVPLPSSAALMLGGTAMLWLRRKKRKC